MVYEVSFAPSAYIAWAQIMNYLQKEFSLTTAQQFSDLMDEKIQLIRRFPLMYPAYLKRKTIRKCVINEQVGMYYQVNKKAHKIQIIAIFDNRQNPDDSKP